MSDKEKLIDEFEEIIVKVKAPFYKVFAGVSLIIGAIGSFISTFFSNYAFDLVQQVMGILPMFQSFIGSPMATFVGQLCFTISVIGIGYKMMKSKKEVIKVEKKEDENGNP